MGRAQHHGPKACYIECVGTSSAQSSSDQGECALCSIKFHATSVELILDWLDRLTFSDGDIYSWKKVTCWLQLSDTASCLLGHVQQAESAETIWHHFCPAENSRHMHHLNRGPSSTL